MDADNILTTPPLFGTPDTAQLIRTPRTDGRGHIHGPAKNRAERRHTATKRRKNQTKAIRARYQGQQCKQGQQGAPQRDAAAPAPHSGPLGNNANSSSTLEIATCASREKRRERREIKRFLWSESTLKRVKKCGRVTHATGASVGVRVTETTTGPVGGLSGLVTCGSVWACPTCAAKIAVARADDLAKVLTWATDQGHTVAMITLTVRHHAKQPLTQLWDGVSKAWGAMTSGRRYAGESPSAYRRRVENWETGPRGLAAGRAKPVQRPGLKQKFGVKGFARAVEVTHGENGWHPHIHSIWVFDGLLSRERVEDFANSMWLSWEASLKRQGLEAIRDSGGLDVKTSTEAIALALADYFVKGLAMEATGGINKKGRQKGRTPFQIVTDCKATGEAQDLDRWHEWEKASHGRRQLTWSQGLRDMAKLEAERTDEEIAAEELGSADLVMLPAETWRAVRAEDTGTGIIEAVEDGGVDAVICWLEERQLSWYWPPNDTENSD